jgi:transcriptional regulator with XRE-family HTH domain
MTFSAGPPYRCRDSVERMRNIMHQSPKELGATVRGLRSRQGISQEDLAARLGVSQPAVSNAERGLIRSLAERAFELLIQLEKKRLAETPWKPLAWHGRAPVRRGRTLYNSLQEYERHLPRWRVIGVVGASDETDICFLQSRDGVTQGFAVFDASKEQFTSLVTINDEYARQLILGFDDLFSGRLGQVALQHDAS